MTASGEIIMITLCPFGIPVVGLSSEVMSDD